MGSGHEDRDGRDHREGGESDQAKPINDHGSKLPVHYDFLFFFSDFDSKKCAKIYTMKHGVVDDLPARYELEFLQDALQLPIRRSRTVVGVACGRHPARIG